MSNASHQVLSRPVEFGDIKLAPTTELAGLAELSTIRSHDERIDVLLRIATALEAEDTERTRIAELRSPSAPRSALPARR